MMNKKFNLSSLNLSASFNGVMGAIKKALWFLGRHAFIFILLFIILDVAFGQLMFYYYTHANTVGDESLAPVMFQKGAYGRVLEIGRLRQDTFNNASETTYSDPFK